MGEGSWVLAVRGSWVQNGLEAATFGYTGGIVWPRVVTCCQCAFVPGCGHLFPAVATSSASATARPWVSRSLLGAGRRSCPRPSPAVLPSCFSRCSLEALGWPGRWGASPEWRCVHVAVPTGSFPSSAPIRAHAGRLNLRGFWSRRVRPGLQRRPRGARCVSSFPLARPPGWKQRADRRASPHLEEPISRPQDRNRSSFPVSVCSVPGDVIPQPASVATLRPPCPPGCVPAGCGLGSPTLDGANPGERQPDRHTEEVSGPSVPGPRVRRQVQAPVSRRGRGRRWRSGVCGTRSPGEAARPAELR